MPCKPSRAPRRRALLVIGHCLLAADLSWAAASPASEECIEAWVELSEPLPAADAGAQAAARQRELVAEQQERVGRALAALGTVELARVRHARNAIAVCMPAGLREQVLSIPGVVRLRTTRTLHPPRPSSAPSL